MKISYHFLLALIWALVTTAGADTYIRNKPVPTKPHQSIIYVTAEALSKYFTPQELELFEFDSHTGTIKVGGETIAERLGQDPEENIPVVALAEALGFQKRVNPALGIVDYVTPATLEGKRPGADVPKRKGAEYDAAAARMARVFQKSPQMTSHPQWERLQKIGQELAEVSDMPGLQWNFAIVRDSSPNAFCTGVGWVAVTDALLALKLTDDELAGIVAHEIGHGCRRDLEEQNYNVDTANKLKSQILAKQEEFRQLVARREALRDKAHRAATLAAQMQHPDNIREMRNEASRASREADALDRPIRNLEREMEQMAATWNVHTEFATATEFQHQDELDADNKGLRYAVQAGYSSVGLMSALQKLAGHHAETFGQAAYRGGQSHPPLAKRIETMRKVLADWRNP